MASPHHRVESTVWRARRFLRLVVATLLPGRAHRQRHDKWEEKWSRNEYPREWGWARGDLQREVVDAVAEGWFPRGGALLDIGCGDGRLSRWLAERGYEVTGIDFAQAAIDKAMALHGGIDRLSFATIDISLDCLPPARFDILLDRGTLQLVEPRGRSGYLRNISATAKPGARFLLLQPTSTRHDGFRADRRKKEELVRRLCRLLDPAFDIERVTDAQFGDEQNGEPFARGIALWLVRREAATSI